MSPPPVTAASAERIWFLDPRGFMVPPPGDEDRLVRIVPLPGQALTAQLNAIMRFALYYGVLLVAFRRSMWGVWVPLLAGGLTWIVYSADSKSDDAAREKMAALQLEADGRTCDLRVRPTRDNPYMNVLLTDIDRFPTRPAAADVTDPRVSRRVEKAAEHDLYRDQVDVFDRNTSSRQFYTTASTTIPNDQGTFASWLYGTGPTCKEGNGDACSANSFRQYPST